MCYFLTVAVPAKHVDRIGEVFARGFQTDATENPSVTAALPAGYQARLVTSGMCSCDLYVQPRTVPSDSTAHLRRKYEKLGWSEAKIQRAVEQAVASQAKRPQPISGFRDDVTDCLRALCRMAGSVAFLVHWYNGEVETEHLLLHSATPCDCDELATRAQQFAEDEVLIATARRH